MKLNKRISTSFGPDIRFELRPSISPFRDVIDSRFEYLQEDLLETRLKENWEPGVSSALRRASHEAAALAWLTPYPLLVFPELFEEKADVALRIVEKQERVRAHTRELLAV